MEKKEKTDRRVKYTKMVLKDSLIKLMREKPIGNISIKEICETADINRSTFYAHYNDQYDLLHQLEQELLQKVNAYLEEFHFSTFEPASTQIINRIFTFIQENAESCRVLLGERGDLALQKEIMMIVQRQSMKELPYSSLPPNIREYLVLFNVNGSIGIVQNWLQTGMKESPREMAELIVRVTQKGLSAFR